MSVRRARWLLFGVLFLCLPFPMLGPFDVFAPALRYLVLFGAASAVAWVEGAAGPVPAILALLGLHALAYLAACFGIAWAGAAALGQLPPAARRWFTLGACAALLLPALLFNLYRTPFGQAPVTNLLGLLS